MRSRSLLTDAVTLAAFCGFLLFFGLGAFGLVGADEPRYAQIAREMLARHDWVTPVLNGKPWLEKPILYYWEAMIAYAIFGVSDWAARIPSAVSASSAVFATYSFWKNLKLPTFGTPSATPPDASSVIPQSHNSTIAVDAALIALTTAGMIGFGRAASTDMPLAANFAIGMMFWIAWYFERHSVSLIAFYVFMALATLAKGPVAPALAVIIIAVFAVTRRDFEIVKKTASPAGLLVFFAIAAPWYWLVQQRTGNFYRVFLLEHNIERFGTNVFRHHQPVWYYVPVLLLAMVPWTVFAITAFVSALRNPADRRRAPRPDSSPDTDFETAMSALRDFKMLLVVWGVVPIVFFSISQSKLPGYILPAIPAWTLLMTQWLGERLAVTAKRPNVALTLAHAAIGGAIVAAVIVAPYRVMRVPITKPVLTIAVVFALAMFAGTAISILRSGMRVFRFVTLVPVVIAIAYVLRIAAPAIDAKLSARPVAHEIARIESKQTTVAVLHVKRDLEYGLNFYRNQPIASYDRAEIPTGDHLVVARAGSDGDLSMLVGGRRVVHVGDFAAQDLEFFFVTSQPAMRGH